MKKQVAIYFWLIACSALAGAAVALPIDAVVNGRHYAWYVWTIIAVVAVVLFTIPIVVAVKHRRQLLTVATATGVTHDAKKDVVLTKGTTYTVTDDKKADLTAGEYLILAVDETTRAFNLRHNGAVREYRHHSKLVLAVGDTVTAVSGNVILRRA